jgi:copper(I)-binding protein
MPVILHRRHWLRASAALAAAAALPSARACEFWSTTLRITHPWSRASRPGETEAVVCMKFDDVQQADRLVRVVTPVARSADIGGLLARPQVDFAIPEGQTTLLAEEASFLRLRDLNHPLEIGRAYPFTLVFEHGGEVQALLSIDFGGLPRFG